MHYLKTKKRAIITEALMRLLLTVGLIVFSVGAGAAIVKTLSPAKDETYLKNAAGILNDLTEGEMRPYLIGLSENNAIVGFSKGTTDFKCVGCATGQTAQNWESLQFNKPQNQECSANACVCLCKGIRKSDKASPSNPPYRLMYTLTCENWQCKKLNLDRDIPQALYLFESYPMTPYPNMNAKHWPYWENGFFFENSKNMQNGVLNADDKKELSLQAKKLQGTFSVAACSVETQGCMYEIPQP